MKLRLFSTLFAAIGLIGITAVAPVALAPVASAAPVNCSGIECAEQGANEAPTGSAKTSDLKSVIKLVVNIMLFIIGAVSVIMIVVGGIKYTVSNGNAELIKSAKNTIMYAIVGIIVAILAYAIVNFVISTLK